MVRRKIKNTKIKEKERSGCFFHKKIEHRH